MELVTADTILTYLQQQVENKVQLEPNFYVDTCQKLCVLLGDEHDKLFNLQQEVAKRKVGYIESGDTVAKAKVKIEAEDIYKEMQKQRAKIERIEEMIRISKIRARLKDHEYGLQ